ncbi:MAG: hypothetical protein IKP67_07250 [Spirochaetales bacterium]|nr:hypothetical protein [Spirochaetales bacterium]
MRIEKLDNFIKTYYNNAQAFQSLFDPYYDPSDVIRTHEPPNQTKGIIGNILGGLEIRGFGMTGEMDRRLLKKLVEFENAKTFSQYLFFLIDVKKLKPSEVYKNALIDRRTFSKIKSDEQYHPTKLTALAFCIGLKLTLDESKELLSRAGYSFSPCDKTDLIFSFFLEEKYYDIDQINVTLAEHGLQTM